MKKIYFGLLATFTYNTAIAVMLSLLSAGDSFFHIFIFTQCIGFSIVYLNLLKFVRMQPGIKYWASLCVTLPASIAVGITLAFWLTGTGNWSHHYALSAVLIGLVFGIIANIIFVLFDHIEKYNLEIKQRMLSQAESEKREIDAQLKMLQKQIEPHFLHNTLANAGSLISSDPVLAKRLLERLKDWQSVALAPARSDSTTLDDEMNMLENYLQILKLRFGDRLHWRIDAPEDAHVSPFPPLLLQPLFENAVRQGAELNRDGGGVVIRANVTQDKLRIELNGSGAGLHDKKGSRRAGQSAGAAGKLVRRAGRLMPGKHADGVSTATLDLPIMKLSS